MRSVHSNPMGAGSIYELHNLKAVAIRLPAYVVIAALYGKSPDAPKDSSLMAQELTGFRSLL